jgi:hypothetical protein
MSENLVMIETKLAIDVSNDVKGELHALKIRSPVDKIIKKCKHKTAKQKSIKIMKFEPQWMSV